MEWIWLPLVAALLDLFVLAAGRDGLKPFTKPAVPAAVFFWTLLVDWPPQGMLVLIQIGVFFAFLGEVFQLPGVDRFLPAAGVSVLTSLAWTAGLNLAPPPINLSILIFAAAAALPAVRISRRVMAGIRSSGKYTRAAVWLYALALSVFVFSGLATLGRDEWLPSSALLAAGGAVFFALSKIFHNWNRFVEPLPQAELRTRISHHVGMIVLTAGVLLQHGISHTI